MNIAVILSGGSGSRMKAGNIPKQYLKVGNRPVICYCLAVFQIHTEIDAIIIVAEGQYRKFLNEWIVKDGITKFKSFAEAGRTRQHSVYAGVKAAQDVAEECGVKQNNIVVIHDAARPCVSETIITDCIEGAVECGGAMPVITVKDTVYQSTDGRMISSLLNRDELFAGQAPEAFRLAPYLAIHDNMTEEELETVRGSSEAAYRYGMEVKLVKGDEANYKITTREDLEKFQFFVNERAAEAK